jgi:hypothetical protein
MELYKKGSADAAGTANLQDVTRMLASYKVHSYGAARVLLEIAKKAIKKAMEVTPVLTSSMKASVKALDTHAQMIGSDTSNTVYPHWDDLRHDVIVALTEYNAALEGARTYDTTYWQDVSDALQIVEKKSVGIYEKAKEGAKEGAAILQGVFVLGGLAAVAWFIHNWAGGERKVSPNVNVGLLPVPHLSIGAHQQEHGE